MSIHLVRINESETDIIAGLADRIWRAYYIEFISMEQIDYMLNRFYSRPSLLEQISEGQEFYKIMDDDEVLGFVSISRKAEQEYFIHKFYILNNKHKKNIGSTVMNLIHDMIKMREEAKATEIRLTVNRQNYKAINFYFKNGFRIERVADFDIGNGYFMNDFVMLLK